MSKVLQGDPDKVLEPYIKGKGNARALSDKALEASGAFCVLFWPYHSIKQS